MQLEDPNVIKFICDNSFLENFLPFLMFILLSNLFNSVLHSRLLKPDKVINEIHNHFGIKSASNLRALKLW